MKLEELKDLEEKKWSEKNRAKKNEAEEWNKRNSAKEMVRKEQSEGKEWGVGVFFFFSFLLFFFFFSWYEKIQIKNITTFFLTRYNITVLCHLRHKL